MPNMNSYEHVEARPLSRCILDPKRMASISLLGVELLGAEKVVAVLGFAILEPAARGNSHGGPRGF